MVAGTVSAVLITYRRRETVLATLAKLRELGGLVAETIVVDNGSDDGTAAVIAERFAEVRLLQLPTNRGVAAYNEGFCAAQGEYLLILDDDSYPSAVAVREGIARLARDPELGAVAFRIADPETGEPGAFWFLPDTEEEADVIAFAGCGALARRELVCRLGGYAPEFFLYENEIDLGLRLRQAGARIRYCPELVAYHPAQGKRGTDNMIFYGSKNKLLLIWNYLPVEQAGYLTLSFLRINLLLSLRLGKWRLRWGAVARALLDYPGYCRRYVTRRCTVDELELLRPVLAEFSVNTWRRRLAGRTGTGE